MTSDKNGRSTTTPQNRNMIETPTKSSAYRSPNRSALDALLLSSRLGNSSDSKESASLLSHDNDNSNDSATPTAIKASFLLSNANTSGSMGISNTGGGGSARKASKPLPGLPPGKSLSLEEEEEKNEQDDMITEHEVINGKVDDEFAPPSLPSFSNLKLSEMRMSGMWFAQS